ncbi:MAG TPA: ABC transporter permease [Methylomirabilota bacterium]|jgi:ABC-2 type transport system permease protein|nr:ABC transporter permease [Methylomirabilota bacterium]
MQSWQLIKINILMLFRNKSGLFWTLLVPALIYISLSVLPIGVVLGTGSYSAFLLPGVIALTIMQGGIYTLAYWMTDLRGRGIIKSLSTTPLVKSELVISLIISRTVIMFLQALLLTFIGIMFFHVVIHGSLLWVLLFVILGGIVFLPIGLLISTFAKSYESAAPITAGIGLPLIFLGGVFYPVSLLPKYLQTLGTFLPISFLADALRKVYLTSPSLYDLSQDLIWLCLWSVLILIITLWQFKFDE